MIDFIIVALLVVAFALAIRKTLKTKGCAGCPSSSSCNSKGGTCTCSTAEKMVEDIDSKLNID